jgi:hypothetical protein
MGVDFSELDSAFPTNYALRERMDGRTIHMYTSYVLIYIYPCVALNFVLFLPLLVTSQMDD